MSLPYNGNELLSLITQRGVVITEVLGQRFGPI